ncbi:hypothetical protein [Bradyrhizobium sp. CCBAU 11386]|uniref:hypothetical protein n=1 Tax=Bradyrhizobium sp. CCBAU 11386 TaxID=1630837 RepID=UPI0023040D4D|nr:hypothetical protein [Bradyrhizobium sp. CCBAU 11386]
MGLVVQFKSSDAIEASGNRSDCNIVPLSFGEQLSFGEVRQQIAQAERSCEILRQSIDAMQRSLSMLEGVIEKLGDHGARETFRHKIDAMSKLLSLRLGQLSSIDQMLLDTRRHICLP